MSYRVISLFTTDHKSKLFRGVLFANTTCDIYGFCCGNFTMELSVGNHCQGPGV